MNNHSVRYRINGSAKRVSLYLNYANTAGAFFTQLRMVAELRNADPGGAAASIIIVIVGNADTVLPSIVALTSSMFYSPLPLPDYPRTIALNGHLVIQAPHLMHLFESIVCIPLGSPEMASTGHCFLQDPQPLQPSVTL